MLGYTAPCPVHAGIHPPPAATAADGTHPTGMHSSLFMLPNKFYHRPQMYDLFDKAELRALPPP